MTTSTTITNPAIEVFRTWLADPRNANSPMRPQMEQSLAIRIAQAEARQAAGPEPHDEEAEIAASILAAAGRPVPTAEREPQTEEEVAASILANFRGQR